MRLSKIIKTTPDNRRHLEVDILDLINESFIGAMRRYASPLSTVRQFSELLRKYNQKWYDDGVRDKGRLRQRSKGIFIETFRGKRYDSLIKIATGYSAKYGQRLNFSKDIFKRAVSAQCAMQVARYGEIYAFELYAFAMEILLNYFKIYEQASVEYDWLFDADSLSDCLNTILDFDDVNWDAYIEFLEMKDIMAEARKQAEWKPTKRFHPEKPEDILKYVDYSLTAKENMKRIQEGLGCSDRWVRGLMKKFNIDKDTLQPITNVSYERQIESLRANLEYERSSKNKIIKEKDKEIERLKNILKLNNIRF